MQDTSNTTQRDLIRRVFMANGFTVKPGQDDLKEYVFKAGEALIDEVALPRSVLLAYGEAVRNALYGALRDGGLYPAASDLPDVDLAAIADRYASQVQTEPVNQQLLAAACKRCDGSGWNKGGWICKKCKGTGSIAAAEAAQPVVPPLSEAELGYLIVSIADSNGFDVKDPDGADELCRAVARAIEARNAAQQPSSAQPVAVPEWGGAKAFHEGRALYEGEMISANGCKGGWRKFGDIDRYEQAHWIAKAAMLSAAQKPVAVPDGYVLVPVEPTQEMIQAWRGTWEHAQYYESRREGVRSCYRAMLSAAKKPEGGE